jgi:hypothetical protein
MTEFRRRNAMRPGLWVVAAMAVALAGCGGGGEESTSAPVQTPSNRAPTISGSPSASATAGAAYSFTPTAADLDNNTLTFSITNKPSWATFSTSTGALSGTPAAGDVGTSGSITITVSDGTLTAALANFTITVAAAAAGNTAPTISGTPAASIAVGQTYTFTPSASDANSDTLTFSITNKPTWATFTASNGRLTGMPAAGDVATYSNIVISVSDGKAAAVSLPAFSIAVNQISTGSATVSWTPPTTNTDGSALTVAGYRVYYDTSATSLTQSIQASTNVTTQLMSNLSPAT